MAEADSNRMLLSRARETGFAEDPPDPTPTLIDTRFTSEGLGQDTSTVQSQEIRADRQVPDVIRTDVNVSGTTNHELSYGTFDDILESAFQSSGFSTAAALVSSGSVTFTASSSTVAATGIHTNAVVGEIVKIENASNAANNGYFKVATVGTDEITVERGATSIADEGPTASVDVTQLASITNGTTFSTYVLEKHYQDLGNVFEQLFGCAVNQLALTVGTGEILTMGLTWAGASAKGATSTLGDGSNSAASSTDVLNAVDNVVRLAEGSVSSISAQNVTVNLNNNLRPRNRIATLGAFGMGSGQAVVTGSVQAYFSDAALLDAYLDFTESYILTRVVDAAGNVYVIDVPKIKYTNGRRVAGGINQDIVADLSFSAMRRPAEDVTIRIAREPAS